MKILLHDYGGYDFIAQLSEELAGRGHQVRHVYFGYNNTPKGMLEAPGISPENLAFSPIFTLEPFQKYAFVKRWRQEREYGRLLVNEVKDYRPDRVVSAQAPLDAQHLLQQYCRQEDLDFTYWVQDLIGLATRRILSQRLPLIGHLIGVYYARMEIQMLKNSRQVIVIDDLFTSYMSKRGVDTGKITVIPNWAPIERLPVRSKRNKWAIEHGLANKFVFMYTGTLALKHDPSLLLELAQHFRENQDVYIIVVSTGPGAEFLRDRKNTQNLENLLVMDYQSSELLPQVLGTADVLVAQLKRDAGEFSIPSKILSYCCAGRPILAAMPLDNPASRLIDNNGLGLVSAPKDRQEFFQNARRLYTNKDFRDRLGLQARAYADLTFDIEQITSKFEKVLQ